jgi:hypothetical protein
MKALKRSFSVVVLFCLGWSNLLAQLTPDDYKRADSVQLFSELIYNAYVSPTWIEDTHTFWYEVRTRQGREMFLVNAARLEKIPAFDQEKLAGMLSEETGKDHKAFALDLRNVRFNKEATEVTFVVDSIRYRLNRETNELTRLERLRPERREQRHWAASDDELSRDPVVSPDSTWVAFIKNFNVFVRNRENDEEYQLSFDGSEGNIIPLTSSGHRIQAIWQRIKSVRIQNALFILWNLPRQTSFSRNYTKWNTQSLAMPCRSDSLPCFRWPTNARSR